jgi:DinB superfamily
MNLIARPTPAEFAPYYAGYIARIPEGFDPLTVLATQYESVPAVLLAVPRDREAFRYAPEKWTVTQVVGHVGDAERIFSYRLLRIARGDPTPLPGFEEKDYVRQGGFEARALGDVTADWVATRRATIAQARGLDREAWTRSGTASGHGVSARALLYIIIGHVAHHMTILKERYGIH